MHLNFNKFYFQQPFHASSIEQARKRFGCCDQNIPVFVGGKKIVTVQVNDLTPLSIGNNELSRSEIGTSSYRSLLFLNHGSSGMLYRVGENVTAHGSDGQQLLLNITNFFSVSQGGEYNSFVKGTVYEITDALVQPYGGRKIVRLTPNTLTLLASAILRKVMLYPVEFSGPVLHYSIIDFLRPLPEFPIGLEDIIVPVYPAVGDMVQICGESDQIWYGHILSVEERTKLCQVHFYVEDESHLERYHRESHGRAARESISWSSIIKCMNGIWEGNRWIRQ